VWLVAPDALEGEDTQPLPTHVDFRVERFDACGNRDPTTVALSSGLIWHISSLLGAARWHITSLLWLKWHISFLLGRGPQLEWRWMC
jgi:hypothetical protein